MKNAVRDDADGVDVNRINAVVSVVESGRIRLFLSL